MAKRRNTNIDKLGKEIDQMIKEGKTQREIARFFGFKDKTVVHQYLKRKRKKRKTINGWHFTQTSWTRTKWLQADSGGKR